MCRSGQVRLGIAASQRIGIYFVDALDLPPIGQRDIECLGALIGIQTEGIVVIHFLGTNLQLKMIMLSRDDPQSGPLGLW